MFIELKLLNGEELEQEVDSNVCVIGRSSKCHIVVPHEGMSRTHCQIEIIGGDYFVTDLGSTNGVLIDGKKIEPNRKIPYQTYLTLAFGAVQSLQIREDLATSASPNVPTRNLLDTSVQTSNTMTRTKVMGQSPKTLQTKGPPRRADKKAEKNEKLRTLAVNIIALLMVLAAAAWYVQDGVQSEAEYSYKEPKKAAPSKK